jgi:hypothetical protein
MEYTVWIKSIALDIVACGTFILPDTRWEGSESVQVPGSNSRLYPRMIVEFAFLFDFPKDMVGPLAVIMYHTVSRHLMGFCCSVPAAKYLPYAEMFRAYGGRVPCH